MLTLIELYDSHEPIFNVIIASTLRPQEIVFFTDRDLQAEIPVLKQYFNHVGMETVEIRQMICNLYDLSEISARLCEVIDERGEENCVFECTGGSEAMLLGVGMTCAARNINTVQYNHETNELNYLWGKLRDYRVPMRYSAGISARIALSGGERNGNGHIDISETEQEFIDMIPLVFRVFQAHRTQWAHFVLVMQQLRKSAWLEDGCIMIQGPAQVVQNHGVQHVANLSILMELASIGVLDELSLNARGCSFSMHSQVMLDRLCDTGSWLELYLYYMISRLPCFDDVDMNVYLNWDNDPLTTDTRNELDVIATAGPNMFLISCKMATPQMSALNEIATLTRRFGGRFAVPVIATTANLSETAPAIVRRAYDMRVEIIDADDLENEDKLNARLTELANMWNNA